jgi:uncharacterized membrane protein YozB (DUF420 family)
MKKSFNVVLTALVAAVVSVVLASPAMAAIDQTAITAAFTDLQTVFGVIVAGLISFAALWMVGKKAYRALSGS